MELLIGSCVVIYGDKQNYHVIISTYLMGLNVLCTQLTLINRMLHLILVFIVCFQNVLLKFK